MKIILSMFLLFSFNFVVFGQQEDNPPIINAKNKTKEQIDAELKERRNQDKEIEKRKKQLEKEQRELDKITQKANKDRQKAEEKARNEEIKKMYANLGFMANFPNDFVGKKWVANVLLGEMQRYSEQDEVIYFINAQNNDATFYPYLAPNRVAFALSESMARDVFSFYKGKDAERSLLRGNYMARLIFEMNSFQFNGNTFYLAKINCVEFLGLFSIRVASLGNCQL